MSEKPIVIVAARRTAIGSFQGQFSNTSATQLGSTAISAALESAEVGPDQVDEVFMGCVLPANLGQAPARQASLGAGVPDSAGCTTVNKVCGSGMKAIMLGHDAIRCGTSDVVVAGGMESMTNAPYMLPKGRQGYRMGHGQVIDHMIYDGLQNPYDNELMGHFAELCVEKFGFSREQQDAYAERSIRRALEAMNGVFQDEIAPVTVKSRKGESVVDHDEEPPKCNIEKIPNLKPAFKKNGTVTPANSSKISDGGAATVLMSATEAEKRDLKPMAYLVGHASHAQAPEWFTTAPAGAIKALQERIGWSREDVDLYEINEAFACVAMAAVEELGLDEDKVNVNGGACALGHPIGCTGARLTTSLLYALQSRGLKRGIAALCIGGGEATAIAVELA